MTPADAALLQACRDGDWEAIKRAVESGADVNVESPKDDNETPLMLLLDSFLYEEEPDDSSRIRDGIRIMQYLLEHRADINHAAVQKNPLRDMAGNFTGEYIEEYNSAILTCAMYTPLAITRFAFAHGADPNMTLHYGETALDQVEFDLFAMYGGDEDDEEPPPCEMAVRRKILLEHGALNSSTLEKLEKLADCSEAERSLLLGCWHWDVSLLRKAWDMAPELFTRLSYPVFYETVRRGFTFEWKNSHGDLAQLEERLIKAVAFFLEHGISVNAGDGDALYCAAREGLLKTVAFLLQAGAIPQSCNCSYFLPAGAPPHYYTLLEKIKRWKWCWDEATGAQLFRMISAAAEKWATHPLIEELAYHPSKGERSELTARQIAEKFAHALEAGKKGEIHGIIHDLVRSDVRLVVAGDERYYGKYDFDDHFRRHFQNLEDGGESLLQVTSSGCETSGELCISWGDEVEHLLFVCENGMIVKACLEKSPKCAG